MAEPAVAPYGSWRSPLTADLVAARGGVDLRAPFGQAALDGDAIYWVEGRPAEGGRAAIVRRLPSGDLADLLPPGSSARSRVNEYGGGAFTVAAGTVFFTNDADQRVWRLDPDGRVMPLTPPGPYRHADLTWDAARGRVLAVREDHGGAGEPAHTIVAIDAAGRQPPAVLARGADFYAAPRPRPDGRALAWLQWHHPQMPWDGTELWVGQVGPDGHITDPHPVAGGADEAVVQPAWSPDGTLHFVSDRAGWWNLWRVGPAGSEPLCLAEADFAVPPWVFGATTFGFVSATHVFCAYVRHGEWGCGLVDARTGTLTPLGVPWTEVASVRTGPGAAVFCAASPAEPLRLVRWRMADAGATVLRGTTAPPVPPAFIARAEPVTFPTAGGHQAHGFFYRPRNPAFVGPPGERPPLLVQVHGGPTAAVSSALDPRVQFWTTRGIAVLEVNYRGSTGYGRAWRRLLDGQWGVADVEDCVAGARHLVARGEADGRRLAIRGSSAGGFTALRALMADGTFAVGGVYYGISDLEALVTDTHKFEAHYLDRLVGPYPAARATYRERSPIHHADRLRRPVILFQGTEDRVVPPAQSERLVAALRARGLPVAYLPFPGEGHGFRRAESVAQALEAELCFYGRVLGFVPADPVSPAVAAAVERAFTEG